MRHVILTLSAVLWTQAAMGEARAAVVAEHEVSTGAVAFTHLLAVGQTPTYFGGEVGYHVSLGPKEGPKPVRVGAGARTAAPFPSVPIEGFLQVALQGQFGIWRPAVGLELGVGGFARVRPADRIPDDAVLSKSEERLGPAYLAFSAAPIRFAFGRFRLSALEADVGPTFPPLGGGARLQLRLLTLGFIL